MYKYLLDLLPSIHPIRLTVLTACNRLANKCSITLDDRYKPTKTLSSRDYPKTASQISAFDVDEALNLITLAENALHLKDVFNLILRILSFLVFVFSLSHANKHLTS